MDARDVATKHIDIDRSLRDVRVAVAVAVVAVVVVMVISSPVLSMPRFSLPLLPLWKIPS